MASQATLDKAASFQQKHQANDARLAELAKLPETDATKKEIRQLKNSNSSIEREFATDKDLANLSLGRTTPAERLGLIGLGIAPPLLPVAVAVKAAEVQSKKVEPPTHAGTPDSTATQAEIQEPVLNLKPLDNPLHNYPSYTYGLSLHLLTKDEYNLLVKKPQEYIPKRVLIASAGRHDPKTLARSSFFNEDFYFDNLNINTVIGLNERSRSTNAVSLNFSIIEPYGITLLNRILEVNASIGSKNYLSMPYVIQIDFFGISNDGTIVGRIENQTKTIPIQLLKMDVKTGVKGTEYQITAVPYNHSAYDMTTVTTPIHLEITANSLTAFFKSPENHSNLRKEMEQREEQHKQSVSNVNYSNALAASSKLGGLSSAKINPYIGPTSMAETLMSDPIYKIKSYTEGINAYYLNLAAKEKNSAADQYFFKFHPDIIENGGGDFNLRTASLNNSSMANTPDPISMKLGNDARIFSINTGTSIDAVLNYAIRNSNYIQNQLVVPEDYKDEVGFLNAKKKYKNKPLNWYKIIPVIELNEFDDKTNQWSRNITYNIVPYKIYNTKIPSAPQGVTESPVKVYNYYYTGKNDDIIDLNIEFNAVYYTAITSYVANMETVAGIKPSPATDEKNWTPKDQPLVEHAPNDVQPPSFKKEINTKIQGVGNNVTSKDSAAADTEQSILTAAGADMLNVKVKIIGDPLFVKQDDIFYSPIMERTAATSNSGVDPRLVANGSLGTDAGEVYVQLNFRSPDDIDDLTGLMKFNARFQQSVFSGMYRVLTVDNTFTNGQFTQTLDMVRLPRQTRFDYTTSNRAASQKDQAAEVGRETTAPVVSPQSVGIIKNLTSPDDSPAPNSRPIADQLAASDAISQEQRRLMNQYPNFNQR